MSLLDMNLKLKREMARAFSSAVWRQAPVPKDRSSCVHVLGGLDAPAVAEHGVLRRAVHIWVPREEAHVGAPQVALEETGQRQGA